MTDPNDPSELTRQMAEAVEGVHPEPPPFANLTAIRRRRNMQWMAAGGAITVVVLVIAGLAIAGVGRGGSQRVQVGPVVAPNIPVPASTSTVPAAAPTSATLAPSATSAPPTTVGPSTTTETLPPVTTPATAAPSTTAPVTTFPPTRLSTPPNTMEPLGSAPITTPPVGPPTGSTPFVGGDVFQTVMPSNAAFASGSFFVAWQSQTSSTTVAELGLVDPATGRIEALTTPDPPLFSFGVPIESGGSVWVTAGTLQGEELLRLDPHTLQTTGQWPLDQGGMRRYWDNDLVAAGGSLWVADGPKLLRVSPASGAVTLTVTLPSASGPDPSEASSDVATDAGGTALYVGEADSSGAGALERRDPATGQLLTSHPLNGVSAPKIGGISGSAVWVSEASGMLGSVQAFDTASLSPTASGFQATNGIAVRVADDDVWVTDPSNGPGSNTCADPTTGKALATIPLPQPAADLVLAIGPSAVYYVSGSGPLQQLPIPAACQG